jgi:hypothetical protein
MINPKKSIHFHKIKPNSKFKVFSFLNLTNLKIAVRSIKNKELFSFYNSFLNIVRERKKRSLHLGPFNKNLKGEEIDNLTSNLVCFDGLFKLSLNLHNNINPQDNSITETDLLLVASSISELTNLSEFNLNMYNKNIKEKGGEILGKTISKLNNLKKLFLQLDFNQINNQGLIGLSKIFEGTKNLSHLTLSLKCNNITHLGFNYLSERIKTLCSLTYLNLDLFYNCIGENGALSLSNALSNLKSLTCLNLDLSYNKIKNSGISSLSNSLGRLSNLLTLSIILNHAKITDNGLVDLSVNCLAKLEKLQNLELNLSNNKISKQGLENLYSALNKNFSMQSLRISLEEIEFGENPKFFMSELSKMINLTTFSLNLASNMLTNKDEMIMSESLMTIPNLTYLDIDASHNNFGDDDQSLFHFSNCLKKLKKLKTLKVNFSSNEIRESAVLYLISGVSELMDLTSLDINLEKNKLSEEIIGYFKKLLDMLPNLTNLNLNLGFDPNTLSIFKDKIKIIRNFKQLDIK